MKTTAPKCRIPMSSETVQAGFPSPAEGYIEKHLDLNEHLIKHQSATFFVKASGESMLGAGIFPGDLLIVDRALNPVNGSIVIAVIDGEFTVKRLSMSKNKVELRPENRAFKPIPITEDTDFQVWGVVAYVVHVLRTGTSKG